MFALNRIMLGKGAALALGFLVATSLWSADFSFTNGTTDGLMGAASRRAAPGNLRRRRRTTSPWTVLNRFGIDDQRFTFKFQGLDQKLTGTEKRAVVVKDILI